MPRKNSFKIFYALSLVWQLGFLVAVPIGGFLILGLWLDKKFDSSPIVLIAGIAFGMIVVIYEIYHLIIPLIDNRHVFSGNANKKPRIKNTANQIKKNNDPY